MAQLVLDEMADDLRVGLGLEFMAGGREALLELQIILDDAVVHDDELLRAIGVRMGVLFRWAAVRGPAAVAEPDLAVHGRRRQQVGQLADLADAAAQLQPAAVQDGDARRVVAPVFEALEALEQDRRNLLAADVPDDAAHPRPTSRN